MSARGQNQSNDPHAVLAAAGYNFSLLLRWLERLLRALIADLTADPIEPLAA